ncbi:MAG: glutamine--fructose-6-phosphate transaminase (isomerizing) [Candidatus Micrarchaeota archaeon]|nr:glutamine--fructose-6-phosphate transaminase (isomerizing) [Candidatus Micrarchaeota archaeon]
MCGIVGYIGHRQAAAVLLHGLTQVEYRGYDSAGMAVMGERGVRVLKAEGKLSDIHRKHNFLSLEGGIGLGHTRWATHGPPCEKNAHPQEDCTKRVAVIHNGIIENNRALKEELEGQGHKFISDTDTEIVAHLIEEYMWGGARASAAAPPKMDAAAAVKKAVERLEGAYSLGMLIAGERRLFLARRHAPLIIGQGKDGEMFFASDIPALLSYTRDFILLNEGDVAQIDEKGAIIWGADGKVVSREKLHVDWTPQMAAKGGYEHFMLKEILEQPTALAAAVAADVKPALPLLKSAKSLAVVACGTSYYASLVFQYLMHKTGKPCAAYIGSEYSSWVTGHEDVVIAVSQSGETADTLSAVRLAKTCKAKVIAITNVVGSTLSREADVTIYIGVGPEVGVVATKSFTGQLCVLSKIAYELAGNKAGLADLAEVPKVAKQLLEGRHNDIKALAKAMGKRHNFFFIARGVGYPCALEAALKLKEITYLHAEAYPGGELKHGPISMLEKSVPVVAIAPSGELAPKMESNIKECKARGASLIVLSDDAVLCSEGEEAIVMPPVPSDLVPIYYILPLQLLAYYMTVNAGKDPDQPRNLAKSVTVE